MFMIALARVCMITPVMTTKYENDGRGRDDENKHLFCRKQK